MASDQQALSRLISTGLKVSVEELQAAKAGGIRRSGVSDPLVPTTGVPRARAVFSPVAGPVSGSPLISQVNGGHYPLGTAAPGLHQTSGIAMHSGAPLGAPLGGLPPAGLSNGFGEYGKQAISSVSDGVGHTAHAMPTPAVASVHPGATGGPTTGAPAVTPTVSALIQEVERLKAQNAQQQLLLSGAHASLQKAQAQFTATSASKDAGSDKEALVGAMRRAMLAEQQNSALRAQLHTASSVGVGGAGSASPAIAALVRQGSTEAHRLREQNKRMEKRVADLLESATKSHQAQVEAEAERDQQALALKAAKSALEQTTRELRIAKDACEGARSQLREQRKRADRLALKARTQAPSGSPAASPGATDVLGTVPRRRRNRIAVQVEEGAIAPSSSRRTARSPSPVSRQRVSSHRSPAKTPAQTHQALDDVETRRQRRHEETKSPTESKEASLTSDDLDTQPKQQTTTITSNINSRKEEEEEKESELTAEGEFQPPSPVRRRPSQRGMSAMAASLAKQAGAGAITTGDSSTTTSSSQPYSTAEPLDSEMDPMSRSRVVSTDSRGLGADPLPSNVTTPSAHSSPGQDGVGHRQPQLQQQQAVQAAAAGPSKPSQHQQVGSKQASHPRFGRPSTAGTAMEQQRAAAAAAAAAAVARRSPSMRATGPPHGVAGATIMEEDATAHGPSSGYGAQSATAARHPPAATASRPPSGLTVRAPATGHIGRSPLVAPTPVGPMIPMPSLYSSNSSAGRAGHWQRFSPDSTPVSTGEAPSSETSPLASHEAAYGRLHSAGASAAARGGAGAGIGGSGGDAGVYLGSPASRMVKTAWQPDVTASPDSTGAPPRPSGADVRNFLRSVPLLHQMTEDNFVALCGRVDVDTLAPGNMVTRQGDPGDRMFIIMQGAVVAYLQTEEGGPDGEEILAWAHADDDDRASHRSAMGKAVAYYGLGDWFGERSLFTGDARASSCVATEPLTVVTIGIEPFEELLLNTARPWLNDKLRRYMSAHREPAARMLESHTRQFNSMVLRSHHSELEAVMSSFVPELSVYDIIERAVITCYSIFGCQRVGLFVVDRERNELVLKVSSDAQSKRLPISGIAGAVVRGGRTENIIDAYEDTRFDQSFDRITGFRTQSMLCLPIRPHPDSTEVTAVLQVLNKTVPVEEAPHEAEAAAMAHARAAAASDGAAGGGRMGDFTLPGTAYGSSGRGRGGGAQRGGRRPTIAESISHHLAIGQQTAEEAAEAGAALPLAHGSVTAPPAVAPPGRVVVAFSHRDQELLEGMGKQLGATLEALQQEMALDSGAKFTPTWRAGSQTFACNVTAIRGLPLPGRAAMRRMFNGRHVTVEMELFHGDDLIAATVASGNVRVKKDQEWITARRERIGEALTLLEESSAAAAEADDMGEADDEEGESGDEGDDAYLEEGLAELGVKRVGEEGEFDAGDESPLPGSGSGRRSMSPHKQGSGRFAGRARASTMSGRLDRGSSLLRMASKARLSIAPGNSRGGLLPDPGSSSGAGGSPIGRTQSPHRASGSPRGKPEKAAVEAAEAIEKEEADDAAAVGFSAARFPASHKPYGIKAPVALAAGIAIRDLPRATRIIFTIKLEGTKPIAWAGMHLFDYDKTMRRGKVRLPLWPGKRPNALVPALDNRYATDPPVIEVELPRAKRPIIFTDHGAEDIPAEPRPDPSTPLPSSVKRLLALDPLHELEPAERQLLWRNRHLLSHHPSALPKVLRSVDWSRRESVQRMHRLLRLWALPSPLEAMQLLDSQFPDPKVRAYAVQCLEPMPDRDLILYMLQLVQVLKNEPFHDSALARFLIRRSLLNTALVGHVFFWYLQAEMHQAHVRDRFGVLLDIYLKHCGEHRVALGHQQYVLERLYAVSIIAKKTKGKATRLRATREALSKIVWPTRFQLPIRPSFVASGVITDSCRVMSSKKLPLMLDFVAADGGKPFKVMYKNGDDLRQDQLTLQVMRVMNAMWLGENLDLCMLPYECVSTGDELGMLEIVMQSETLGHILAGDARKMKAGILRGRAAAGNVNNPDMIAAWMQEEAKLNQRIIDDPEGAAASAVSANDDAYDEEEDSVVDSYGDDASPYAGIGLPRSPSLSTDSRGVMGDVRMARSESLGGAGDARSLRDRRGVPERGRALSVALPAGRPASMSIGGSSLPPSPTQAALMTRSPSLYARHFVVGADAAEEARRRRRRDSDGSVRSNGSMSSMAMAAVMASSSPDGAVAGGVVGRPDPSADRAVVLGQAYATMLDRFARSCAGSCVSTYLMGIGDRHADNLMMTKNGTLFHIDFGHFLGNWKYKLGVRREPASFKFTLQMVSALGGPESDLYRRFEHLCGQALNILRRQGNRDLLITLFSLMTSCGIPELRKKKDIDYLRNMFLDDKTDEEAAAEFCKQALENSKMLLVRADDWAHQMKHWS